MEFDFSGYATKNNIRCSDGRTIVKDAFKHNHGSKVPLVYQHRHDDASQVLGHAILENRDDGVYAYCKLNSTPAGKNARILIEHGDLDSLSIWANNLTQNGSAVIHGDIKEVSLVLSGANPGAHIDNLAFQHSDGSIYEDDSDAIIQMGIRLDDGDLIHAEDDGMDEDEDDGETVGDVVNSMSDKQKNVMYALIAEALSQQQGEMAQSDIYDYDEGGNYMKHNVFMDGTDDQYRPVLSHSQFQEIIEDAKKCGSFKEAFLSHAQTYGIENIDILFPDAKTVTNTPDFIKRRTEWVSGVISGTKHVPFSRIKSTAADITADEARARGYVKGNLKKEEVIKLLKRTTTPTTIYKKQKLDRDDIIDITDLNVVAWLKAEMRLMLDEEIARAILISDGREADSEDKINEENIRPIWKEDEMYATHVVLDSSTALEDQMETILRAMDDYEGSGSPTLYTTQSKVTDMLLLRDKIGRRLYNSESEVANALGVDRIVKVPLIKNQIRTVDGQTRELVGIIVNLNDYVVGADKGGNVSMFDDFDIDYNQYKYLMETRISGALIHPKSAVVVEMSTTAG